MKAKKKILQGEFRGAYFESFESLNMSSRFYHGKDFCPILVRTELIKNVIPIKVIPLLKKEQITMPLVH